MIIITKGTKIESQNMTFRYFMSEIRHVMAFLVKMSNLRLMIECKRLKKIT